MNILLAPLASMFGGPQWKWLVASIAAVSTALHPDLTTRNSAGILLLLVCADFILGLMSAFVVGEPIQSRKMWRTAYKLLAYTLIPASVWWAFSTMDMLSIATFASVGIVWLGVITETLSILESAKKAGVINLPPWIIRILEGKRDEVVSSDDGTFANRN